MYIFLSLIKLITKETTFYQKKKLDYENIDFYY